ncbi:MAG: hypothetical protein AAGL98_10715 [Planctomycetota bacterium]
MKKCFAALWLVAALGLGGCTYYQIHDPHSGKTYYTNNWESKGVESGVIVFKDAASGSQVTLASHEIKEIEPRKYKASVSKQLADQP